MRYYTALKLASVIRRLLRTEEDLVVHDIEGDPYRIVVDNGVNRFEILVKKLN